MFYIQQMDKALRFGDVLQGYPSTTPIIEEPILKESDAQYNIDVNLPRFTVVMDPCCEIRNKMISLTPLIQVSRAFFNNPYFAEDLTRINREMEPQQAVSPLIWEKLDFEEKQKRLEIERTYALLNLFVYEKNDLLPKYILQRRGKEGIETHYYMIDFRNTYKLRCGKIITPENSPFESKILQLSIETRDELRKKLVNYYANVPLEDKVSED
ncbi:unnamed protein product [marine sediment metagenome]|uniref:Uncharacterized protein n=1 Tax=marine sediment metagenome TaxID=412755 RepID=X1K3V5_9ZZZZ